jgi:hypothetical protein
MQFIINQASRMHGYDANIFAKTNGANACLRQLPCINNIISSAKLTTRVDMLPLCPGSSFANIQAYAAPTSIGHQMKSKRENKGRKYRLLRLGDGAKQIAPR